MLLDPEIKLISFFLSMTYGSLATVCFLKIRFGLGKTKGIDISGILDQRVYRSEKGSSRKSSYIFKSKQEKFPRDNCYRNFADYIFYEAENWNLNEAENFSTETLNEVGKFVSLTSLFNLLCINFRVDNIFLYTNMKPHNTANGFCSPGEQ